MRRICSALAILACVLVPAVLAEVSASAWDISNKNSSDSNPVIGFTIPRTQFTAQNETYDPIPKTTSPCEDPPRNGSTKTRTDAPIAFDSVDLPPVPGSPLKAETPDVDGVSAKYAEYDGGITADITLNEDKLLGSLAKKQDKDIEINIISDVDHARLTFPASLTENAPDDTSFRVTSNIGGIGFNSKSLSTDEIDAAFPGADHKKVTIEFANRTPTRTQLKAFSEAVSSKTGSMSLIPPKYYSVSAKYGDKTTVLNSFDGYLEHLLPLPDGFDELSVTAALAMNADGTIKTVPYTIIDIKGKKYAAASAPTNSLYSLTYTPKSYTDTKGHWCNEVVTEMAGRLALPDSNGKFRPDDGMTRSDFTWTVVRAFGLEKPGVKYGGQFRDVSSAHQNASAIQTAVDIGIISGTSATEFTPERALTRQEAAVILHRVAEKYSLYRNMTLIERKLAYFKDGGAVADWALPAVESFVTYGLLHGSGKTLRPADVLTRAECFTLIHAVLISSRLI